MGEKNNSVPIVYLNNSEPSKCVNCADKHFILDYEQSVFDDAKIICLQNSDLSQDLDEQLEIMVCGDYTKDIRAGETLTIHGRTYIGTSNNAPNSRNTRKLITVMVAKFVVYEERRTFDIIDRDIDAFHRFVAINRDTVIDRLISMTAPNVVGWKDVKLGLLRSIVGGTEQNTRGRINSLLVGDKGLAKSLLVREAIRMSPNSRYITAHSASSRSALGIVDTVNETKTLIYGPIPLSSGAMIGIDELQTWTHDDQGSLLNVMEEGWFILLKYGKGRPITALTTVLATANPQDIIYNKSRTTIAKGEITLLPPLYDRFDQVFVFLDNRNLVEKRLYADKHIEYIERKRPHNYTFITKYLLYVRSIEPALTPVTRYRLKEFWLTLSESNLAGNRSLESILRISSVHGKVANA